MSQTASYAESRRHELRRTRLVMIDGSLAVNNRSAEASVAWLRTAGTFHWAASSGIASTVP